GSGSFDGIGTAATFNQPQGIIYDGFGDLYISDGQNNEIRKIAVSTGAVSTIAGTTTPGSANGTGIAAGFNNPAGLSFDASGNLYVADQQNNEIREIVIPNFYAVTVTDKNGCKSTASASALVYPVPKVTVSSGTSCIGAADTLIAHAIGTGPSTFSWSPPATGDTDLVFSDNIYSVTITDSVGCTASVSKSVVMNPTPTVTIIGNGAICSGINDTLIANASGVGALKYLWSTASTQDTVIATVTSIYSVTVIDNNGCESIAAKSVNADSLFTISISSNTIGGTTICSGLKDTLVASASGIGPFIYTWSTSGTQDTVLTTSAGIYSIAITDGAGCRDTASIRVIVNPSPTINLSGNVSVCAGINDTLIANATGIGTLAYFWSTLSTTDTVIVTATNVYSCTVTDSNGCNSTATKTVTINSLPGISVIGDIVGGTTICSGLKDTLTAKATGNGTFNYKWNTSGTNDTILVTLANTYSVTVTDKNGCMNSGSTTVTVNPTPTLTITGNNNISVGTADTLTASGATTYAWSTGSTNDSTIVKPTTSSKYTVIGKSADGCIDTASFTVIVTGVIDPASNNRTILYPNPTIGDVNLSFEMQGAGKDAVIKVIDNIGKEVLSEAARINNGKVITLNVNMLAQGMYFVKVITDDETQVVKFIKQ
ncbi:MAG TPA: T9SS type A sorting domain-containing protein, partial [Bacteroidia bacterium]|nr:T9SS type A sorting domain-containing protein [Bacteroidia bacterium]